MSVDVETDGLEVVETREWLGSMDYILRQRGRDRALSLLERLCLHVKQSGIRLPFTAATPYVNTIPVEQQPPFPGSQELERRIKSLVRWNALAMVVRANKQSEGIGGHISPFSSPAPLYDGAFNHLFHPQTEERHPHNPYFLGHAAPRD